MSRIIGTFAENAVNRDVTTPRYLVSLNLDRQMYLSTFDSIIIGETLWESGNIQKIGVGELTANLTIYNPNYVYTAAAVRGEYTYRPVTIMMAYPYAEPIPDYFPEGYLDFPEEDYIKKTDVVRFITVFRGYISNITRISEWMEIQFTRNSEKRFPSVKIRAPLANHLPAAGEVVTWKGQTYRIED